MKRFFASAAAVAIALASPASAATLVTNGSGQLTGATGVMVNGTSYDVEFVDGTCTALFGGCDSSSDFTFQGGLEAQIAAQALLDQVFLDGPAGLFDSIDFATSGCHANTAHACEAIVPYGASAGTFLSALALNNFSSSEDFVSFPYLNGVTFDSSGTDPLTPSFVFARFTPAAAVPEPSTWTMMLLGFAAIGFAARRRRALATEHHSHQQG